MASPNINGEDENGCSLYNSPLSAAPLVSKKQLLASDGFSEVYDHIEHSQSMPVKSEQCITEHLKKLVKFTGLKVEKKLLKRLSVRWLDLIF